MTEDARQSLDMEGPHQQSFRMSSPSSSIHSPKRPKLHHLQQQEDDDQQQSPHTCEGDEDQRTLSAAEAPFIPPSALHLPQQQGKCRLFYTRHGCSFGNSCLFLHSAGNEPVSYHKNKAIACTKFFSTSGCPYGDRCLFSHYVPPEGVSSLPASIYAKNGGAEQHSGGSNIETVVPKTGTVTGEHKSQLCNQFGTLKGCQYGDHCHFAHGEKELHRLENDKNCDLCVAKSLTFKSSSENAPRNLDNSGKLAFGVTSHEETGPGALPSKTSAAAFGTSSRTLIDIDASLVGPIIGRKGMHAKHICRLTGARLCIRKHETDVNLRVLEMEGSFEQVKQAGKLVKEVLFRALPKSVAPRRRKLKVCDNFPLGKCAFGNKCHFVHAMAGKS